MKVYKCITPCTWKGQYWGEDMLTGPLPDDATPPEHFEPVTSTAELQEVLNKVDQEDDPDTFAALQRKIMDEGNTGVGICASDELQLKNFKQLQKIAKEKGVYNEELRSKEALIGAIESIDD